MTFWFIDWKIACVIGSTAWLLEGTMKPTFLHVARSGREVILVDFSSKSVTPIDLMRKGEANASPAKV